MAKSKKKKAAKSAKPKRKAPAKKAPPKKAPPKRKKRAPAKAARKSAPLLASTCSGGGPVIAVPSELATRWRGTLPPIDADVPEGWSWGKSGGPMCDYDRISAFGVYAIRTEYGGVGTLAIGDGFAIALDAELLTLWLPLEEGGAILRNVEPMDEAAGRALVDEAAREGWKTLNESIVLRDGRLFLFDSAFAGAEDPSTNLAFDGVVVASPGPGIYHVDVASPGGRDVIRLRRI